MSKQLLKAFSSPGSEYRSKPFWAWNGRLDQGELRRQVRLFHKMGMGGFFMHSRTGLETVYLSDEWFDCIRAGIDEAEKLGMEAWLYDEDRWPSGVAGGLVTKNPEYRMRSLVMERLDKPQSLKWTTDMVAVFTARVDGCDGSNAKRIKQGSRPVLAKGESILVFRVKESPLTDYYNGYAYLDTLNPAAVRAFIESTHEAYRKEIGEHFGKSVPGIFTDEVSHGAKFDSIQYTNHGDGLPWTGTLPSVFKERYGYGLLDHLPELFLDMDGQPITPARHNYHDCTTYMLADAFSRQIGEWCEENNMMHTGHVLAEDLLSSQAKVVGSCMRFYEFMQVPGMDLLTENNRAYDTAKQVASAANQFGRKRRMTELYAVCTGWDFSLSGHKALGDWQVALGLNLRCQHLSLYTMEGEAKRDYPASIFYQSPWWEIYSKVEDYYARIHAVMTRGHEVRDLLVIHPVESAWMFCNKDWLQNPALAEQDKTLVDLRDSLLAANIDFDYGDEDILARHGKAGRNNDEAVLRVGKAKYKAVVVPPMVTMRGATLELLENFKKKGGTVIFSGSAPRYVDALESRKAVEFAASCPRAPLKGAELVEAVQPTCRRISITDESGRELIPVLHLLREDKENFYLFICNVGHDFTKTSGELLRSDPAVNDRTASFGQVRVRGFAGCAGKPLELDPDSGETYLADATRHQDGWEIQTSLPKIGSRLFMVPKKNLDVALPKLKKLKDTASRKLNPPLWDITLSECNNLVLDRPQYKIGKKAWRAEEEILRIDRRVRADLGLPYRGGEALQPWARPAAGNPPSVPVKLSYAFDVKVVPSGDLFVGMERPELYHVSINEIPICTDADQGWWVDKSLRKIQIDPALLKIGENRLEIGCDYNENHPGLEAVYLLGSFGTRIRGTKITLTEIPGKLELGDWTKQGLSFYSGAVGYKKTIMANLASGERMSVRVPEYEGTAVRVWVNGKPAGVIAWEPNEVEITELLDGKKNELTIEVFSHRRNSHGPLHRAGKKATGVSPVSFMTSGESWSDEYKLVPCGLTQAPEILIKG